MNTNNEIQKFLETIDELKNIGLFEYRSDREFMYLSPNCRAILNLSASANISASALFSMLNEEHRRLFSPSSPHPQDILQPMQPVECSITTLSGAKKWIRIYRKRFLENGVVISQGVIEDIALEMMKRLATEQFQDLYENAPYGYHTTFLDGRISDMNHTMLNYLGYSLNEARNSLHLQDILSPKSYQVRVHYQEKIFKEGILRDFEAEFIRKDGSIFYGLVTITLVRNNAGEPIATRSATIDLTERKKLEETERKAQIAKEAQRVQAEFMNMLSHEFRTPLGIILGAADALKSFVAADGLPFITMVEAGGNRLLTLLNNVLELAQTESEASLATFHRTDIRSFFRHIHEQWATQMELRGIEYVLELSDTLPQAMLIDIPRLERIMVCVLENAFKFTENGFVSLVVTATYQEQNSQQGISQQGILHVRLSDTGIGIPEHQLPRVFEAFFQAYSGTTRQFDGAGIGLTVVRNLVQQLGGSVQISSRLGAGTTVSLAIPFRKTH
ncbi:MAG: PAS domain-containing sensor histidine kinase [Candidatus Kapaibacterium sp.]|nr:MAG: PAS domain-containing sensor histidine kinase [Candidatus Kapabacteria bacterium]